MTSINTSQLAGNAVASEIQANAVNSSEIAANAVSVTQIDSALSVEICQVHYFLRNAQGTLGDGADITNVNGVLGIQDSSTTKTSHRRSCWYGCWYK